MGFPRVVWFAAVAAFLSRFPGALWPLRPDEAGFLLVARTWQPQPDSVYGRYFVDRPPPIIWLVRASDAIGGPYALRLIGAVGCLLLVLAAAAATREMAARVGVVDPSAVRRLTGWVAVGAAAVVGNAAIDPVSAKGEVLGIPLVMASCWLSLRAVRRVSLADAFWAGLLAVLAVGLKQSIVGGLVFGGALLIGSGVARHLTWHAVLRCAAAAAAGAAVPVAVVVVWALAVGVRLQALWYVTVGFRSDANDVISQGATNAAIDRIWYLVMVFVGVGMLLLLVCFLVRLPALLRRDAVVAVAIACTITVDLLAVAASGSYWTPYLFVPVPGLVLALAALALDDHLRLSGHQVTPAAVAFVAAASVFALVGWTGSWALGRAPSEVRTGEAIAAAARPGDRVLVYGGRADIQWASRAQSPYPYLWSLPMRVLDPRLVDLRAVLTGNNPPTWFIETSSLDAWSELGTRPVERSLIAKYELVGTACGSSRIYHLNTVEPVHVDIDCTSPFRTIWNQ